MASGRKLVIGCDAFGQPLVDALRPHLEAEGFQVEDLGSGKYYEMARDVGQRVAASQGEARGLLVCGSGMGMSVVCNKVPGCRAAVVENVAAAVNSKSINDSNVLTLGAMITEPEAAKEIVDAWLGAEFRGPAPANKGEGWPDEIKGFLAQSLPDIAAIEQQLKQQATHTTTATSSSTATSAQPQYEAPCPLCVLAGSASHPFAPVAGVEGAEWVELRGNPTRAIVRFKAGAVEPAHHHTEGHDVFVVSGRKTVENLTRGEAFELQAGSYLYTAGGEQHRVTYHTDTEFIICCDGKFDVFWDEPLPSEKEQQEKHEDA